MTHHTTDPVKQIAEQYRARWGYAVVNQPCRDAALLAYETCAAVGLIPTAHTNATETIAELMAQRDRALTAQADRERERDFALTQRETARYWLVAFLGVDLPAVDAARAIVARCATAEASLAAAREVGDASLRQITTNGRRRRPPYAAEVLAWLLWTASRYRWTKEGCATEAADLLAQWGMAAHRVTASREATTPPTLTQTRTGTDWCPSCLDEVGTDRTDLAGGPDLCGVCLTVLVPMPAAVRLLRQCIARSQGEGEADRG